MKYFICCLVAATGYYYAHTQDTLLSKTFNFYGHVIDSASGKPVADASLLLSIHSEKTEKKLSATITDSVGKFQFNLYLQREYLLTVSATGYWEFVIKIHAVQPADVMSLVKLIPSPSSLQEVVVTASKPTIKSDIDKLIYYAENDITSSAGDAQDVLRKTPMVTVDPDGNVALRGSSSPRILVNGKTSSLFFGNVGDALKSIPAAQISRIEIITNPSAKYDGEGSAGIINIITKKNFQQGMNGNMSVGISNMRNNASVNFAFKKNNFLFYINLNGNFSLLRKRPGNYVLEDFVYKTINRQGLAENDRRHGAGGTAGIDFSWKKYNQVQASVGINGSFDMQSGEMKGLITDSNGVSQSLTRIINAPGNANGMDYYLEYTRLFKDKNKTLSFSMLVNDNRGLSHYGSELLFKQPDQFFSEKANKKNRNTEMTFQGDFSSGWGKGKIETGAKIITRNFVNDFEVYNYDGAVNDLVLNRARTNLFQFSQNVFAVYMQYAVSLSKTITLRTGARAELTTLSTLSRQFQQTPSIKTNYLNILPSLAIAKSIGAGNHQVKLSYSKRLQRPGTIYMNPFISAMTYYSRTQGNPYLQPEIVHSPELSYTLNHKNNFYGITLFYRTTQKIIERYTILSQDSTTGNTPGEKRIVSTTTYDNIGKNKSWGVQLTSSINIYKRLNVRTNLNVTTNNISVPGKMYHYSKSSVRNTILSFNVNAALRLDKGYSLENFFTARTQQQTIQGSSNGFTLFYIAVRKNILKDAASLGFVFTEPFRKGTRMISETNSEQFYVFNETLTPYRSIAVNFNLNFGKLKSNPRSKRIQNDDLK